MNGKRIIGAVLGALLALGGVMAATAPANAANAANAVPNTSSILALGVTTIGLDGGVWHMSNLESQTTLATVKANQLNLPGATTHGVVALILFTNPGGGFAGRSAAHIVNTHDSAFISFGSVSPALKFRFAVFEGVMGGTNWQPGCPPNHAGPCTYNGTWGP